MGNENKIADICYQISTAERMFNGFDKCFVRLCLSQYNGPRYEDEIRDPEIIEFLKNRYKEIIKNLKKELDLEIDKEL